MSRYHVNADGPAVCKATVRPCPLALQNEHFETLKEAESYYQKNLEDYYGLLSPLSKKTALFEDSKQNFQGVRRGEFSPHEEGETIGSRYSKDKFDDVSRVKEDSYVEIEDFSFMEKAAVNFYSANNYAWFNGAILKGARSDNAPLNNILLRYSPDVSNNYVENFEPSCNNKETVAFIRDHLDRALEKGFYEERIVYKGVSSFHSHDPSTNPDFLKTLQPGAILNFKGYMSTSLSGKIAKDFATQKGVIYEIKTRQGVNISALSDSPQEQEVLLPREQKYRIENIFPLANERGETPITVIQMTAID